MKPLDVLSNAFYATRIVKRIQFLKFCNVKYLCWIIAVTLASCATKTQPFAGLICDEFLVWAESGPRDTLDNGLLTRTIHFPNSSDCYNEAANSNIFVFKCLTINWDCPEKTTCADQADRRFKEYAFGASHYWNEFSYFQNIAECVGAVRNAEPWNSDKADVYQVYNVERSGYKIDMDYNPDNRLARIKIIYKLK